MRNCIRSWGIITRPWEQQYLQWVSHLNGWIDLLPEVFSGVKRDYRIINTEIIPPQPEVITKVPLKSQSWDKGSAGWGSNIPITRESDNTFTSISSSQEFAQLVDQGSIQLLKQKVKRKSDTWWYNKAEFPQSLVYDSASQKLQVHIEADTIMFTAQGQDLNVEWIVLQEITNDIKSSNPNTEIISTIEFGTPWDHLIFTKPVKISVETTQPE